MAEALERSFKMAQRLQVLNSIMAVGFVLTSEDLALEFANEQARELLAGESADQALASRWDGLREAIGEHLNASSELKARGGNFDLDLPCAEGARRLRFEVQPLEGGDEHGEGYLFLLQDYGQIEALETDLCLATRFRALTTLYLAMAHDLKAPLNALAINLDLLKTTLSKNPPSDPILNERQQRYLKVLTDELARLNRSLQSFVAQTLPPSDQAQAFNLRELVLDLISLVAPQARKQQVALEIQLDEEPIVLEGAQDQLKQGLLNIAVNALEAMPNGGRLKISLETRLGQAAIRFQDSGPGIPPELLKKIWEMHFTTKKTGTGIGLYVARSIIEGFGGSVAAESHPDAGTSFLITLPISSKEAS